MKLTDQQKKEILEQQSQQNMTKELFLLSWKKYYMKLFLYRIMALLEL